jgi:hypothetical protein
MIPITPSTKQEKSSGSVPLSIISFVSFLFFMRLGLKGSTFAPVPAVLSLIVFAYSGAPFISGFLGKHSGSIFMGSSRFEETPLLSEAKSTANDGNYSDAVEKYQEVLKKFPRELKIYRELFILYRKMGDPKKMRNVYQFGHSKLKGEKMKKLARIFREEKEKMEEV